MKETVRSIYSAFFFFLLALFVLFNAEGWSSSKTQDEMILVGRISYVEGELLRYVPEEQDWVATVKDAPFGLYDTLYAGQRARGEIILPNEMWVRISSDTQLQLMALQPDVSELDVAAGVARFDNKNPEGVLKVTTPFGYVVAPAQARFDLYVGEDSMEIVPIQGKIDFVHAGSGMRYEAVAGTGSLLADNLQVVTSQAYVDPDWDQWNVARDEFWEQRMRSAGESTKYLPEPLQQDAYVLDEYGSWERVYYEGSYYIFWRPVRVPLGWAPFTVGRWTLWFGDLCWIPAEPFGYITHHYGNWIFIRGLWYWAPPLPRFRPPPPFPLLRIGFGWYPGRVVWIYSGVHIGWIPLAPFEPYYAHRPWGPRAVVVRNVVNININIQTLRFVGQAVVVNQNNFFRVNSYAPVRIKNLSNVTIINNYVAAPVVNRSVIRNYDKLRRKYDFCRIRVGVKPHKVVTERIHRNRRTAERRPALRATMVRQMMLRTRVTMPARGVRVGAPKLKSKLVPVGMVNRPVGAVKFKERSLKPGGKKPAGPALAPKKKSTLSPRTSGKSYKPSPAVTVKPKQLKSKSTHSVQSSGKVTPKSKSGSRIGQPKEKSIEVKSPGQAAQSARKTMPKISAKKPVEPAKGKGKTSPAQKAKEVVQPAEEKTGKLQKEVTTGAAKKPPKPGVKQLPVHQQSPQKLPALPKY